MILQRRFIDLADDAVFVRTIGAGGIKCFWLCIESIIVNIFTAFRGFIGAIEWRLTTEDYAYGDKHKMTISHSGSYR